MRSVQQRATIRDSVLGDDGWVRRRRLPQPPRPNPHLQVGEAAKQALGQLLKLVVIQPESFEIGEPSHLNGNLGELIGVEPPGVVSAGESGKQDVSTTPSDNPSPRHDV